MEQSLIPLNEAERMALLRQLNILDTETEDVYDGIVYIASKICKVPVSTITLIDHDRQWFKAAVGAAHKENPRIYSFCARAILGNDILEVPDSHMDARFKDNPLVKSDPFVRFYAGVPLELKNGLNVGTLCVIDHKPNKLNDEQLRVLRFLGLQVTKLLELRLKNELLQQKQKALNDGLRAALEIQKSFLPASTFRCNGFQIASFWYPANLLGGDIFNVIKGKEKIIFYVVDVCGHDIPSALVSVSVSQFFYQYADSAAILSPKEIMKALNQEYPFERFDRFFTIFYFVIDPLTGYFKYCCAGHPSGILIKRNGEFKLLSKGGSFIGIKELLHFDEAEGILEDGDKVFLYTDGIIELKNQKKEEFGTQRFYALLKNLHKESVQTIVQEVYKTLKEYSSDFKDDVSLLAFEKETVKQDNKNSCNCSF